MVAGRLTQITMTNYPIGIFDSGVGGLSIARRIRSNLPHEDLLYVADSANTPYGDKPQDFIQERAHKLVEYLLEKNAKAIVIACNTATVATIAQLRARFEIPIIGVEPGVKPATLLTQSNVIGVLATAHTLQSRWYKKLESRHSERVRIEPQACPGLAERVEQNSLDSQATTALLQNYLRPLLEKGSDTIVLGCTHYEFLAPGIDKILDGRARLVKTSDAVATQVYRRLVDENLLCANNQPGQDVFITTRSTSKTQAIFDALWGRPVELNQAAIR